MPLQLPSGVAPSVAAQQIIQQVNSTLQNVSGLLQNGVPARGPFPAVAASDLLNAIGSGNYAKLQAAMAALA